MKIKKTERLSSGVAQLIGTRIKVARIQKRWTQKDLALHAKFKQPDISEIEKGKVNLTLSSIFRLEAALSCELITPQTFQDSQNSAVYAMKTEFVTTKRAPENNARAKIEEQLKKQAIDILVDQGAAKSSVCFGPPIIENSKIILPAWSMSKRFDGATIFTTVQHNLKEQRRARGKLTGIMA